MILNKPIKDFYEEQKNLLKYKIEQFCPTAPTLALVEIGESEHQTNFLKLLRQSAQEIGINCIWYYYGTEDELKIDMILELKDIEEFSDLVYCAHYLQPPGYSKASKTALNYIQWNDFSFIGKNIAVIGDCVDSQWGQYLMCRGATPSLCNSDTSNIWTYINIADLIICFDRLLNCYAIHTPVLDLSFGDKSCYNTENRDVPEDGHLLSILEILDKTVECAVSGSESKKVRTEEHGGETA